MNREDIVCMAQEAGFEVDASDFITAPKTKRIGFQLELERFAALVEAEKDKEIERLRAEMEALRVDAERWRHWRVNHGFSEVEHDAGDCIVTLVCHAADEDKSIAKRFVDSDPSEWLDEFTDAAKEDKT